MKLSLTTAAEQTAPIMERVQFNDGVQCVGSGCAGDPRYRDGVYVPSGNWRRPEPHDLEALSDGDSSAIITIFRIPRYLYQMCWDIGVADSFAAASSECAADDPLFEEFKREATRILKTAYPSINVCTLQLRDRDLCSTTYDEDARTFIGLHVDNFEQQPIDQRESGRCRVVVNLGIEPRSFVFINLDMLHVLDACGFPRTREVFDKYSWAYPLAHEFMRTHPNYPVTRVTLHPGEGYVAPTQNLIHDGYTVGMSVPDFALHGTP